VGAVWFRKEINIPEDWKEFDLALELGPIVDFDDTYFNGEKIGSIKIDVNNFWAFNRRYLIPKRLVMYGKNTIAVRIFAHNKVGGFGGNKDNMNISVINMEKKGKINISGNWKYMVERKLPPVNEGTGGESILPENLYNGMLYPLVGFGIKGFIWYQGESNADNPKEYLKLSKLFIEDLREKWTDPKLPFYFVQIANYSMVDGLSDWPALREAQLKTLKLPNTGMAVAIDIGTSNDIHPKNKQDVGKRLALNALAQTYGKKIEYLGPVYKNMEFENGKLRLYFEHSEGLSSLGNKELLGFEVAGKNKKYFQAKAKIDKGTVLLQSSKVKQPVSARYAWANDPVCNLYNSAKLPASPFRTEQV
jgi:sialate O-acetylesterase